MKNLYIFLLLIVGVVGFGQVNSPTVNTNLSPGGFFDNVYDHYGNKYNLKDIQVGTPKQSKTSTAMLSSTLLCTSGMFELYFETGCGMDGTSAIEISRRNVVCQVFSDLSNFINSPLKTNGLNNKVRIFVRNIGQISGVPSNALGLASAYYTMPQFSGGGIVDNEIWKTIHLGKDSYTNVTFPLFTYDNSNTYVTFYHGMLAINFSSLNNWNTNLTNLSLGNELDLYSVVLHEISHAIGFQSLIDVNGLSQFGNTLKFFNRYDTFLKNNILSKSLIENDNTYSMYNYNFNSLLNTNILYPGCATTDHLNPSSSIDATICGNAVQFVGTNTVPVYTPTCFERGSSLSHFEDQLYPICNPANNNLYFAMSNGIGSNSNKRFLKFEERNTLGDIGYELNTTFGNNTTAVGSFNNYGGIITNGIGVAGLNDGINSDATYNLVGNVNAAITINSSTDITKRILANDTNATSFEGLEDALSYGSFSTTSGNLTTNVTFTTSVSGLHLLRYIPISSTGQRGNITYIFVYVNVINNCGIPTACNIIINGDFEQNNGLLPTNGSQFNGIVCGWNTVSINQSVEYYNSDNSASFLRVPCNSSGYQNDNNGGKAYAGMFITNNTINPVNESIRTKLKSPLLANTVYKLSFDVSLAETFSISSEKFQAYFSQNLITPLGDSYLPISNQQMLFTNPTYSTISNGWERISFTIPARPIAGEQYLYLGGGLSSASGPSQSLLGAIQVIGCGSTPNLGFAYYYVDNVELIPVITPIITGSTSSCLLGNSVTNNSTTLLSGQSAQWSITGGTGTISGANTSNVLVTWTSLPGTLTLTITDIPTGCTKNTTQVINNVAVVSPTFTPIAPICSGAALPLLPTTSTNSIGINGTWSPAVNNTATTTYTFTPTAGQCAATTTLTITVLPASDPSCSSNSNCALSTLTLSVPEPNTTVIYRRQNSISTITNYLETNGKNVTMRAGDFISLKSNTYINSGAVFSAKTEPCITNKTAKVGLEQKDELAISKNIVLFPNPNNGSFELINIDPSLFGNKPIQLNVYDLNGRNLFSKNLSDSEIPNCQLSLQQFMDGMYIVKLNSESYSQDFKFIKK